MILILVGRGRERSHERSLKGEISLRGGVRVLGPIVRVLGPILKV